MVEPPLDFQGIRRTAITALFSDDLLFEKIVLKGGNALNLALGLSDRTSLDLDFSIENDFDDIDDVRARVATALDRRFGSSGYVVFDFKFERKPHEPREGSSPRWGGYMISLKLMNQEKYKKLGGKIDAIRRDSVVVGPDQQRIFRIDLSKCEYVRGKRKVELDDYTVYVYSSEMIAVEKLRAICQQMPEYTFNRNPRARARDFFDIHLIVTKTNVELASEDHLELARRVFAAKEVPLSLLKKVSEFREFHRTDWASVQNSTKTPLKEFDSYFDFVVALADSMKALWDE